jgi:hypothetical protein
MESVVNYLEDTEKKLAKEMAELFSKMREQREGMALKGIEDMYSIKPVEGVLYEPYLRIPSNVASHYNSTNFILPKDEYIVFTKKTTIQENSRPYACTHICIVLTSHGRCFMTNPVSEDRDFATNCVIQYKTYKPDTIIKLEPIPYKIPKQIFNTFVLAFELGEYGSSGWTIKIALDATNTLQELNKEFYLFSGKWQPHMTEHATLDIDKMRETIIENTNSIQDLSGKNRELEEQNKRLQAELQELKEQKTSLEKEKARLLPLEKYKEIVIDFMDEHYDGDEPYDHDDTLDTDIIRHFSDWHTNKVFMNEWDYDDVMESKEELNEYRIYKKVKGEMVSSGMDNSGVARNIRSIKNDVIDVKSNVKEIKTRGYSTRHL